jgi:coproporphyrinogen III oxidase
MMQYKELTSLWFASLRDEFIHQLQEIEQLYSNNNTQTAKFVRQNWDRPGGGGGQMSILKGTVFEKVGVNISTVYGKMDLQFAKNIPGADEDGNFFATGLSFVAHPFSPHIPAAHFNTRYIVTTKSWFGGGGDLTPTFEQADETSFFHNGLKASCDSYDPACYAKFKQHCDEYFFLKHRNEPRGVGGIFFDYLNSANFDNDFAFVKQLGGDFLRTYSAIVKNKIHLSWNQEQKDAQLTKRVR